MGGAYSAGKFLRKARLSWWRDELPTNEEYCNASDNLKAAQHTVDYIITHTMPLCMIRRLGKIPDSHDAELTGFLEWVMYETEFKHWYCGHWHLDADLADDFTVLYSIRGLPRHSTWQAAAKLRFSFSWGLNPN